MARAAPARRGQVVSAVRTLADALEALADQGGRPPCADDPERWFEGGPVRLAEAAQACGPCLLLVVCGAAADEVGERFGVWGGRDRTAEHQQRSVAS